MEDNTDTSINDDEELIALEALLSAPEELIKKNNNKTEQEQEKEQQKPYLRDDSTFAEAFSYEIDSSVEKLAEAACSTVVEELDSSDDEEVKNFLERKYNEYGNDINKQIKQQLQEKRDSQINRDVQQALKQTDAETIKTTSENNQIKNPHKPKLRQALLSSSFKKVVTPKAGNSNPTLSILSSSSSSTSNNVQAKVATYTDPVFGLHIINPLISSTLLIERMSGRKPVSVSAIPFHIERGDLSKDWVFAGAVVNKSPIQSTTKGQPYSIWRISDLRGDIKMVSLFLFGRAHKELWKTTQGMCIAVLNPTVFEKRAKSDDVACLSIDTAQKILVLGQSKDLGTCKSKKRNGDNCTAVINLSECDYCIFHMKQEYGKMSRRSELQSTSGGINELRNKVLGKSEVFYGGQSYTAVPAKKSAKITTKDNQRMSALSDYGISPFSGSVNHTSKPRITNTPVPYAKSDVPVSKVASNIEATSKQRMKDLERLRILQEENERHSKIQESNKSIVQTQTQTATQTATPDKFKNREFSFMAKTPKLTAENFCIEVNVGEKRAQQAKQKAAQLLKQKPLKKLNPNSLRGTNNGKRSAIDELNEKFISQGAKRQKLEEEQREIDRKSRIQRIMDATSSHTNLVDLREQQEQDKYFSKLEKKEALEEKMLSTFKVPCKAVTCQRCKYTAFSAAERCKEEKHPLKVIDAEKRFFQCKDCGNRTATVFKLPKTSCNNCQSSRWERAAMIREKKMGTNESLSLRGDEEMFLGSTAGNANLNLLVAEE